MIEKINLEHILFLDVETVPEQPTFENLSTSYAKNIEVPAFKIDGHIVWGATAMMLSELRDVLNEVLSV